MTGPWAKFGYDGEPGDAEFWAAAGKGPAPAFAPGPGGGWLALFLRRGSPAEVVFESWSGPVELTRWAGSDCWYAEVAMPPRLRVTYQFRGDGPHADPLNPAGAGPDRSIAATPDAEPQPYWPPVGPDEVLPVPRTRFRWNSARLGGRRTVRVHQPAGPGPHPVVLLLDGDDWLYTHPAVTAFEAAVTDGAMPPATLVFLPTSPAREQELAGNPALWEGIRDELLPLLAGNGVAADRLVVAGQSFGGLSALYAALEYPGVVSRVACQSGSFWWPAERRDEPFAGPLGGAIAARLRRGPDLSGLRVAFDVGEHETGMLPHNELVEALAAEAGASVRVSRSGAGHDRAGWRHALVRDVAWALADD
ncbi:alpha/beta hydrolase-fold protein [Amycolatopsis sp. PS_44_ISF1]|uniref:alpha/beta hydrolase-fold protein n=1 Tax=Amycolatopsis sp. PS_44_ISF1 TaxID=2974917 RepID=UPI0028DE84FA|nr:alpha/beta hydrolase-fold protein [Amycolatopsis sp. PS_44_ISF1]MDT8913083.1 alpha/beta hydrolase-fold protein [Amycolatopsis sp. PS_44_ISF1]